MFTKGNIIYSDAFKYLKYKNKPIVCLKASLDNGDTEDDFIEVDMSDPLDVSVSDGTIFFQKKLFLIKPKDLSYGTVKTAIIKMRYSDDDQMALILNREKSEEGAKLYDKMQEWRDFAADIARNVSGVK